MFKKMLHESSENAFDQVGIAQQQILNKLFENHPDIAHSTESDNTKTAIYYNQIHAAVRKYHTGQVCLKKIEIYDDRLDLLKDAFKFFEKDPSLLPSVMVHFNQYRGWRVECLFDILGSGPCLSESTVRSVLLSTLDEGAEYGSEMFFKIAQRYKKIGSEIDTKKINFFRKGRSFYGVQSTHESTIFKRRNYFDFTDPINEIFGGK